MKRASLVVGALAVARSSLCEAGEDQGCRLWRTSSAANVGSDKDSDKRQREAIQRYAKSAGYEVVGEFFDAAVSGADLAADAGQICARHVHRAGAQEARRRTVRCAPEWSVPASRPRPVSRPRPRLLTRALAAVQR
jgi:hypothetical protein